MVVLVTDDSGFLRRRVCASVNAAGFETIEAENGEKCLEAIAEHAPACLFLDLIMPVMDGFEVLKALQDYPDAPPIVVLTADIQDSVREECLRLGAKFFLNKPPKSDEITQALTSILGKG
ncbi:MAG: response regulator [Ghiorsea sp.]